MDLATVESLFTRNDGSYLFARWGRPIVPVVFGITEDSLPVVKGALEVVVGLSGHKMAETDPELGANLMLFFLQDWDELRHLPNLEQLLPDLGGLVDRLEVADASQYRSFRFEENGAIKACFAFVRMDAQMQAIDAEALALAQAAQAMVVWGDRAFARVSPLAEAGGRLVLHPDVLAVIQAGYDRVMPPVAHDKSHALRLAARMAVAVAVQARDATQG